MRNVWLQIAEVPFHRDPLTDRAEPTSKLVIVGNGIYPPTAVPYWLRAVPGVLTPQVSPASTARECSLAESLDDFGPVQDLSVGDVQGGPGGSGPSQTTPATPSFLVKANELLEQCPIGAEAF